MTRYKSCDWLEHGVVFDYCNIVRTCSHFNPIYGGRPVVYENYNGELFDWESFWTLKNSNRENAKNNNLLPECKDCLSLGEKDWSESNYIDRILLTPWYSCNSRCIYCSAPTEKAVIENTRDYKVLPVMKDFIKNNVFSSDASIDFAGGEPTIYPEFDKLLDLFVSNNFKNIIVHTNAIKYSRSIEKAVKKGVLHLLISVDAGSKDMHERVKQVKTFDVVWKNTQKYAKAQKNDKSLVRLKYIILPGINDNKEEIDKWLLKCKSIGVNFVVLNIDFNWLLKNINNIPQHIYDLVVYTIEKSKELSIECQLYPQLLEIKRRFE